MYMSTGPRSAVYNVTVNRAEDSDVDIGIKFKITFDVCNIIIIILMSSFLKLNTCMSCAFYHKLKLSIYFT